MAEPEIIEAPTETTTEPSLEDVENTVGESSSALAGEAEAAQESGGQSTKVEAAQKVAVEELSTALDTKTTISEATINDASLEKPTTADGEKVKGYWEQFKAKILDLIGYEQKANGETGKDISDSEKTKQSLFDKYGKWVLMLALLGTGLFELNKLGKQLSGCYQVFTNATKQTYPVKIGCSQAQCGCGLGQNLTSTPATSTAAATTSCANPTCNSPDGQSQGVNYYWQVVTPLQALAMLPGMAIAGAVAPVSSLASTLTTMLKYAAILLVVCIIGYVIYKIYMNREENNPRIETHFRFRNRNSLKSIF